MAKRIAIIKVSTRYVISTYDEAAFSWKAGNAYGRTPKRAIRHSSIDAFALCPSKAAAMRYALGSSLLCDSDDVDNAIREVHGADAYLEDLRLPELRRVFSCVFPDAIVA